MFPLFLIVFSAKLIVASTLEMKGVLKLSPDDVQCENLPNTVMIFEVFCSVTTIAEITANNSSKPTTPNPIKNPIFKFLSYKLF